MGTTKVSLILKLERIQMKNEVVLWNHELGFERILTNFDALEKKSMKDSVMF